MLENPHTFLMKTGSNYASLVNAPKMTLSTRIMVLNLILKISGIEARNFSTKLFISCSEIVKTSLAVLIRFSEKSDFFVNANALKFTQITLRQHRTKPSIKSRKSS